MQGSPMRDGLHTYDICHSQDVRIVRAMSRLPGTVNGMKTFGFIIGPTIHSGKSKTNE